MDPQQSRPPEVLRAADLLRAYYVQSQRMLDRMMSAEGASFARARLLMIVAREEPVRSVDLAASLDVSPRTVTEAIDGLERRGLVQREADAADRRAKRITITPAGRVAIAGAEAARQRFVDHVFGALSVEDTNRLAELLGKLVACLDAMPERTGVPSSVEDGEAIV